jgi:hypothetical protein
LSDDRFDVWIWRGDWHERVGQGLATEAAMAKAASYGRADRPGVILGAIQRVTIVEPLSDDTVFMYDCVAQAVVFPPEAVGLIPVGESWRPKDLTASARTGRPGAILLRAIRPDHERTEAMPKIDFGRLTEDETAEIAAEALGLLATERMLEVIKAALSDDDREELIAQLEEAAK